DLTGAGAPRVRFRLSSPVEAADLIALPKALGAGAGADARVVAAGAGSHYELTGLAEAPDPALVAALAAWCADRGLLITELRLGSASLEVHYLELVVAGVAAATASGGDSR